MEQTGYNHHFRMSFSFFPEWWIKLELVNCEWQRCCLVVLYVLWHHLGTRGCQRPTQRHTAVGISVPGAWESLLHFILTHRKERRTKLEEDWLLTDLHWLIRFLHGCLVWNLKTWIILDTNQICSCWRAKDLQINLWTDFFYLHILSVDPSGSV